MNAYAGSRSWNIFLWSAQVVLAALFAMAGNMKITLPIELLARQMAWVGSVPPGMVRFIGACELLGAVGLVLPALARIQPRLTIWAGWGLATIMLLATLFHLSRTEFEALPMTLVLGCLAGTVAWGRTYKAPIMPRMAVRPIRH